MSFPASVSPEAAALIADIDRKEANDQRVVVSRKEAMLMLGVKQTKLLELEDAGILKGREALKAADDTRPDDDRDFDQGEEPDEARTRAATSGDSAADLFDPEMDLSIRVGSETLERVLGPEIDMTESFYLECRKTGPSVVTAFASSAD